MCGVVGTQSFRNGRINACQLGPRSSKLRAYQDGRIEFMENATHGHRLEATQTAVYEV